MNTAYGQIVVRNWVSRIDVGTKSFVILLKLKERERLQFLYVKTSSLFRRALPSFRNPREFHMYEKKTSAFPCKPPPDASNSPPRWYQCLCSSSPPPSSSSLEPAFLALFHQFKENSDRMKQPQRLCDAPNSRTPNRPIVIVKHKQSRTSNLNHFASPLSAPYEDSSSWQKNFTPPSTFLIFANR